MPHVIRLLTLGLLISLAACEQQPPKSERAEVVLFGRPTDVDRSLIKEFTFQINGVDALNGHPRTVHGQPMHYKGRLVKHKKLSHLGDQDVFLAHRPIHGGSADWESRPASFNDQTIHPHYPGDEINRTKVEKRPPGEYELRFFLVITENEETTLPTSYLIAKGRLTVESAGE